MEVGFPANGRTINSGELIKIFFEFLPECVKESFFYPCADQKKLSRRFFGGRSAGDPGRDPEAKS